MKPFPARRDGNGFIPRAGLCAKRRGPPPHFAYCIRGQLIAPVVFPVGAVALDLEKDDLVQGGQVQETAPKVLIFHRLFVGLLPAVFLPALQPALQEGVAQIGAVGVQLDLAGLF